MKQLLLVAMMVAAGCKVGAVLDDRIEHNASERYEAEKRQLAELAPPYDAERLKALKELTSDQPISSDRLQHAKSIADKTPAGVAYRKQENEVEIAEYKLASASQRLGPPFGRTAKEMELARQAAEDDRLITALKAATASKSSKSDTL
jgi:hypothetical protein